MSTCRLSKSTERQLRADCRRRGYGHWAVPYQTRIGLATIYNDLLLGKKATPRYAIQTVSLLFHPNKLVVCCITAMTLRLLF